MMDANYRLLVQGSFGPTIDSFNRVNHIGREAWIDEQMTLGPTLHRPTLNSRGFTQPDDRMNLWWERSLTATDQLRQRVAFALSQIFVISDVGDDLHSDVDNVAEFYDILLRNAFGNFRTLLEDVSKSPAMAKYLSFIRNSKQIGNVRPDENYAREIMQLFTIGLLNLNANGTSQGTETYTNTDITELAKVFTGWNYSGAISWGDYIVNYFPLRPNEAYHDVGAKTVLGESFSAGRTAQQDLTQALDLLAEHSNVGPFVGTQLIKRLVTSNPTPAYVARITAVWNDDGTGTRGNLGAVIKAILLDDEAKNTNNLANFGKFKEPVIRHTHAWRAIGCTSTSSYYQNPHPEYQLKQGAQRAPSVFNFYSPFYVPWELSGTYLPEAQLLDHTTAVTWIDAAYYACKEPGDIAFNFSGLFYLNNTSVVDELLLRLFGDLTMLSGNLKNILMTRAEQVSNPLDRAADITYLIMSSPEYMVQR